MARIVSEFSDEANPWFLDQEAAELENEEEALEEEEQMKFNLFEPPPLLPTPIGKIVVDGFGMWKVPTTDTDIRPISKPTEEGPERVPEEEITVEKPQAFCEQIIRRYTMINDNRVTVQVINYGATITHISYPDKNGKIEDIVLGFDTFEEYLKDDNPKFGATLGRYSSIISDAKGKIETEEFFLTMNQNEDHVLGGNVGFDKVVWESAVHKDSVVMTYSSKNGEEGYPGAMMIQQTFHLTHDNTLVINVSATASKPSPISIGNNIFFNLAGHGAAAELGNHCLMVNADKWLMTEAGKLTGDVQNVGGTYYDLRVPRPLGKAIARAPGRGYDTSFCLTKGMLKQAVTFACRLAHPDSGRFMEIHTDQPTLHIYTGNSLPNPDMPFGGGEGSGAKGDMFSLAERLAFLCRDKREEGEDAWPQRMMSTISWPRPQSDPSEEHIFKRFSELTLTSKQSESKKSLHVSSASMMNNAGTAAGQDRDSEKDEYEMIDAESEGEEEEIPQWEPPKPIKGKKGLEYRNHGAISFVAQEYPDAFKFKRHPRPIVYPGVKYSRTTTYKLGVIVQRDPTDKAPVDLTNLNFAI